MTTASNTFDNAATNNARIIAQDMLQCNDTRRTNLNNNDLIIGPTGAGKTRGYVIPNLIHPSGESLIVVDTKGNLHKAYRKHLESLGYETHVIDFVDCLHSECGYDPIRFIGCDEQTGRYLQQDVLCLSAALCPITNQEEPYWDQAAQMTLASLIGLTLERFVEADRSMKTVCYLATQLGSDWLEDLFEDLAVSDSDSFAVREHRMATMNQNAERTIACINGMLTNALNPLAFDGAQHLYTADQMIDFPSLGHKKTALFVTVSDNDRSLDKLVNTFYTQALQELVREADRQQNSALPVPVRFILDDFATNTVIPNFDKMITTIRSRGIAVSLIVQDLTQFDALYRNPVGSIIANNCDTWLYLGGQDVFTAEKLSKKLNKTPSSILALDLDEAFVMQRGSAPKCVRKYDLETDDTYRAIAHEAKRAEAKSRTSGEHDMPEENISSLSEEADGPEVSPL